MLQHIMVPGPNVHKMSSVAMKFTPNTNPRRLHCMCRQDCSRTSLTNCKWCFLDGFTARDFSLCFAKGETASTSPMVHWWVYHKAPQNRHKVNKHQESHQNTELLARHNFTGTQAEFLNRSCSYKLCQMIWV